MFGLGLDAAVMVAGGLSHGLNGETILTRSVRGDTSFQLKVVHVVFWKSNSSIPYLPLASHDNAGLDDTCYR